MSVRNQIYENAWSDRWCLAGSVTTSAELMPASHSLTLVRGLDSLSPVIRSAMSAKSTIPEVEINTQTGTITLLNAKIVNIAPPGPPAGRKHGKLHNTHELEKVKFTFQMITIEITGKRSKAFEDDWSAGG